MTEVVECGLWTRKRRKAPGQSRLKKVQVTSMGWQTKASLSEDLLENLQGNNPTALHSVTAVERGRQSALPVLGKLCNLWVSRLCFLYRIFTRKLNNTIQRSTF